MRIGPAPFQDPIVATEKINSSVWIMWLQEAYKRLSGSYDFIKFNTNTTEPIASGPGVMYWNPADGTIDTTLLNGSIAQLGQELHFYAKASGNIDNGTLCMFDGVQGDHIKVKQVTTGDAATIKSYPHYLVGVATQPISNNNFGYITWFGKVNGVYTTGWSVGDTLYFNAATGQFTNTEPTAPDNRIIIAAVIKAATGGAENGIILVKPSFEDYPEFVEVPATITSTGKKGQMAIDSSFLYVCTATDTWRRATLSSW